CSGLQRPNDAVEVGRSRGRVNEDKAQIEGASCGIERCGENKFRRITVADIADVRRSDNGVDLAYVSGVASERGGAFLLLAVEIDDIDSVGAEGQWIGAQSVSGDGHADRARRNRSRADEFGGIVHDGHAVVACNGDRYFIQGLECSGWLNLQGLTDDSADLLA